MGVIKEVPKVEMNYCEKVIQTTIVCPPPLTCVSEPVCTVVPEGIQTQGLFDAIDRNHDGVLSRCEFEAAVNKGAVHAPGSVVEYWSEGDSKWVNATVISFVVEAGCYVLDKHPSVHEAKVRKPVH